jgi:hypothetical protein
MNIHDCILIVAAVEENGSALGLENLMHYETLTIPVRV